MEKIKRVVGDEDSLDYSSAGTALATACYISVSLATLCIVLHRNSDR